MKARMEFSYYELFFLIDAVKDKIAALQEEQKVYAKPKTDNEAHWAEINESWIKDYEAILKRLQEEYKKW